MRKSFKKVILIVLMQIVCGLFLFAEEVVEEKKLTVKITNVTSEDGEYLVMLVHDINKNERLDTSFIGMPKEPVGLSNYDGKGIPGKFKKHKFSVNENTEITIKFKNF